MASLPEIPAAAFARVDEADDSVFYAPDRLVTHIDEGAIAALSQFYARVLPRDAMLFDLMSSWVSHLPPEFPVAGMTGHGMNAAELAANPRLTQWFVRDLNREPSLPLGDGDIDGAMCCVSVQYLQQPIEVFADVRRVLRAGAPFVVSFSNRCFPTKAVAIWRSLDAQGHAGLVQLYLDRAGFSDIVVRVLADGQYGDPLYAVVGRA